MASLLKNPREILTILTGWGYFGLFVSSSLTLATLIAALDRDLHFSFTDAEKTTRYLNQLLTLVVVFFALLESVLTPPRVLDGHANSATFMYLTHIPKNVRVVMYMLALATVEPHVFNMFFDQIQADVHKPINWAMEDFIGDINNFEGIKVAVLEKGPSPKLYQQFVDDDFQYLLIFSRMFLFVGGLLLLPIALFKPTNTDWDYTKWGHGNQRWYEKAHPDDPEIRIAGVNEALVILLNIVVGIIKAVVPLLGMIFHYNEYVQHRDDPAHDEVDRLYDYYDPFHFNHTVHSVAMLSFSFYLGYDVVRGHMLAAWFGGQSKNTIRNYGVVHLWTLLAHVYLVSTMVDADGSDGEDYIQANWLFIGAHGALYCFQELGVAPYVLNSNAIAAPASYVAKWLRVFFLSDFIVERYMSMLQTVGSVTGMLSMVLLVIGINGPWLHAQPLPGTVIQEFSKVLHETEHFINVTGVELRHFFNHIESSDLFKQLTCTFVDPADSGSAGSDYMQCRQNDISTWKWGEWHPCDTLWRTKDHSEWNRVDMNGLSLLSQRIADIMTDATLTEEQQTASVADLVKANTAGPLSEGKHDVDNNECDRSGHAQCFCNNITDNCVIPYGLGDDFVAEIVDLVVVNTKNYGAPTQMKGGDSCATCAEQHFSSEEEAETCGETQCMDTRGEDEQRTEQDIFDAINNLQANPFFNKASGRYKPTEWRDAVHSGKSRWNQQFGTTSTYDTGFLGLGWNHLTDGTPNGHTRSMKNHFLDEKCMRQCNECPDSAKNWGTNRNTISRHSGGGCSLGGSCECYGTGHNKGQTTEKKSADNDMKGFCMNMKKCFYDDSIWQTEHSKKRDTWNHLRFNNNRNLTDLKQKSQNTPEWKKFEKITRTFYNKGAMTNETANPNAQSTQFARFVRDVRDSGNYAANLKLHDIFCMDRKNQKLPECQDALAELNNFAESGFMTEAEKTCRTAQCDTFLVMMAVAVAMKAAAAAVSLFPFGGGEIGDLILAAEEALEWTIRLVWRFFQFGLRMYRTFRQVVKRVDYYWLLVRGWANFIRYNEFLVTVTMKMMASFLHVVIIGFLSFFIAFWKRQRLVGRERDDVFNLMILLTAAAVVLGACVTVFLALTPWAINWLLDQILTFHHETNFVKNAFIDIKLTEDVGYVFMVLSSVCATYSALCWLVLLLRQKEAEIRQWVFNDNNNAVKLGAPYEFKNSLSGRGTTVANTGLGAWIQTAVVMGLVVWIIYGAFDIAEVDGKYIVRGAVFHVDKFTDTAFADRVAKFFKSNAMTGNYADIDDNHSTLCDLIGQAIKELFKAILKTLLTAVSDVTHQLTLNFSPAVRFLYSAIKRDFDTIMFDAYHLTQLLVVFAPPIACVLLFFVGVTASLLGLTSTSQVWIRNTIFILSINGIAYALALESIADTFDEFKIPIFGYKIEFTTAIFKSQICSMLSFATWVQWRFDEKLPLCSDKTCGEIPEAAKPMTSIPRSELLKPPSLKKRLRMSSLH